jgi:hypothetical protein
MDWGLPSNLPESRLLRLLLLLLILVMAGGCIFALAQQGVSKRALQLWKLALNVFRVSGTVTV